VAIELGSASPPLPWSAFTVTLMAQPFFGGRLEAVLCVAWSPLWVVGVVVATFVSSYGWVLVGLSVVDVALLLLHVARRIEPPRSQRKVLARWLSTNAQYHAWRYLVRKPPTFN
jgi:hypothetical protein